MCDICGVVILDGTPMLALDVTVYADGNDGTGSSWSDVQLCRQCGVKLLDVIGDAMDDLDPNWNGPKP